MSRLSPTTQEVITLFSGKTVLIPKCELVFNIWKGSPVKDDYGGKQVIDYDGKPFFAELAVLKILEEEGISGVWVDSYGKCLRKEMPPTKLPYSALAGTASEIFNAITKAVGKNGGCWDIFAWEGKSILFVECKRSKKDSIRDSQVVWFEQCLKLGLQPENFLLVQWYIK